MSDDPTELYVLVTEDRHIGVEVEVYSTFENANEVLEAWVARAARHPEDIEWDDEPSGSRVRSVTYSCEDDRAWIVRRVLDEEAPDE